MKGVVHSIQTMGTVDGPGVRFVVFLQGCKLRCAYCHNPDTWELTSAGKLAQESHVMDSGELARMAARYRNYYGKQPGITVSGGEPLCQGKFVAELFRECRKLGFHTALDTAGQEEVSGELLDVTSLCLLDIKFTTDVEYMEYTGGSLTKAIKLLSILEERQIPIWIRQVIVPGINDTVEQVLRLKQLITGYHCIEKVELLPFRTLCKEKYEQMGIPFRFGELPQATESLINYLYQETGINDVVPSKG